MSRIDSAKLTAWYDFQAPFYHFWRDNYENPVIKHAVGLLDGSVPCRILDAGCGSGLFSIGMALLHPDWTIEGVDRSSGFLKIAQEQAGKRSLVNVSFRPGDVYGLQYSNQEFDSVLSAGLFSNLNEPHRALLEIYRVLKPGGRFVIVEFDRSTMNSKTRLFFRAMIAGYRVFSAIIPRFRFADNWNIESGTIDEKSFLDDLRTTGFVVDPVLHEYQQLIIRCWKP